MNWYSIKWKPTKAIKNGIIKVSAKNKREAKQKLLKIMNGLNSKYFEPYKMKDENDHR